MRMASTPKASVTIQLRHEKCISPCGEHLADESGELEDGDGLSEGVGVALVGQIFGVEHEMLHGQVDWVLVNHGKVDSGDDVGLWRATGAVVSGSDSDSARVGVVGVFERPDFVVLEGRLAFAILSD
jgi:hypothetical protein